MGKILTSVVLAVIVLLLPGGTAQAQSTLIQAKIAAVRIVVVDEHDQITEIYSNTDEAISPEVRREKVDGDKIEYSSMINQQYQEISANIPNSATGRVYQRPLLPSFLEIFYAML